MSPAKQRRSAYGKDQLEAAIKVVKEGVMNSIQAGRVYKVPSSTIRSHLSKPLSRLGAGRPFYLNDEEERCLIDMVKCIHKIGIRLTKSVLKKISGEYMKSIVTDPRFTSNWNASSPSKFSSMHLLENEPSAHWLSNFLMRNKKEIKMVKEKKLDRSRRDGFSEDVRSGWFDTLKQIMSENDLTYKPLQIWNVDETGFADETQRKGIRMEGSS